MPTATGHRKLLEQLQADGITTMFGNPGQQRGGAARRDQPRSRRSATSSGLQEATVVLIANGYAQATQTPDRRPAALQRRHSATRSAASTTCSASSARRWW